MLFSRGMESPFGYSMVSLKQMEDVGMSRNQISCLKWVKMVKSLILWNHDQWRQSWRWCKFYTRPSSRKFKAKLQSKNLHSFFSAGFIGTEHSVTFNVFLSGVSSAISWIFLSFKAKSPIQRFLCQVGIQSLDFLTSATIEKTFTKLFCFVSLSTDGVWRIWGSGKSANMPWVEGAIQQTPPIARLLHPGI